MKMYAIEIDYVQEDKEIQLAQHENFLYLTIDQVSAVVKALLEIKKEAENESE